MILRVYDPADCDEQGVPLDWERCRPCMGTGTVIDMAGRENIGAPHRPQPQLAEVACPRCGGHGSLKAAALAGLDERLRRAWSDLNYRDPEAREQSDAAFRVRCEDCGHPMSEGTWERIVIASPALGPSKADAMLALHDLRAGGEPEPGPAFPNVHYSPCDERCRHGGPGRVWVPKGSEVYPGQDDRWHYEADQDTAHREDVRENGYDRVEASWRSVDVRTLGWPHDLRPESLAVLCLRCWAAR